MNIFIIIILLFLAPFALAWYSFAPWVPTLRRDMDRMLKIADLSEKDVFIELGSWDWRNCRYASFNSWAKVIWVEMNPYLVWYSKIMARLSLKNKDIEFNNADFYSVNLSEATVIYVYGMPWKMEKLALKLKSECKKWTKVISYAFLFDGLELVEKNKPQNNVLPFFIHAV